MNQEQEAIKVLNAMHIAWIYMEPKSRRQYSLETDIAYYHADSNPDDINRIEREFKKLNMQLGRDYYIQDTTFNEGHIYTVCLKEHASKKLEKMGIELTAKMGKSTP